MIYKDWYGSYKTSNQDQDPLQSITKSLTLPSSPLATSALATFRLVTFRLVTFRLAPFRLASFRLLASKPTRYCFLIIVLSS